MTYFRAAGGSRAYNGCMIDATQMPITPECRIAVESDPFEVAAQLSEALAMLEICRARDVKPTEEFLDYIDSLLCEVDLMELFGRIHVA